MKDFMKEVLETPDLSHFGTKDLLYRLEVECGWTKNKFESKELKKTKESLLRIVGTTYHLFNAIQKIENGEEVTEKMNEER